MSAGTIPPLPKPLNWISIAAKITNKPTFSEDQMREYGQASRKAALDEALSVCGTRTDRLEAIKELK